jgi:hypothetical protein
VGLKVLPTAPRSDRRPPPDSRSPHLTSRAAVPTAPSPMHVPRCPTPRLPRPEVTIASESVSRAAALSDADHAPRLVRSPATPVQSLTRSEVVVLFKAAAVSAARQPRSPPSPAPPPGLSFLAVPAALSTSVVAAKAAVRAGVLRGSGCGAPQPAMPPR